MLHWTPGNVFPILHSHLWESKTAGTHCHVHLCDELTSSWFSGTGFSPGLSPGLAPTGCRTPDSSQFPHRRRGPAAFEPTSPYRTAASSHQAPTVRSPGGWAGGGCSGCYRAWRSGGTFRDRTHVNTTLFNWFAMCNPTTTCRMFLQTGPLNAALV